MEQLFIIRHADYLPATGQLSLKGKAQLTSMLLPQMRKLIRYERSPLPTMIVVSSPAPRAVETAQIIRDGIDEVMLDGRGFQNPFFGIALAPYLWSASDAPKGEKTYYTQPDPSKIMSIIQGGWNMQTIYPSRECELGGSPQDYNVVVIVTHYEVVNEFPLYFIEQYFPSGTDRSAIKRIAGSGFPKGEGVYIDVLKKQHSLLRNIDIVLNAKLKLLHTCLCIQDVPSSLPMELINYHKEFELFKESIKGCTDAFDQVYMEALRTFRDSMLGQ